MSIPKLLHWQWEGYPRYHSARANLLIHIVAVPLFWAGNILLVLAFVRRSWLIGLVALAAMIFSVALQGRGHSQESLPSEPFTSPLNAVARILLEQWINFPRFLLSGGWRRALR